MQIYAGAEGSLCPSAVLYRISLEHKLMKKVFTLLLLLFVSQVHARDYLDDIAQKACTCADAIPVDTPAEKMNMYFGVCILHAFSADNRVQFQKDYGVNLDTPDKDGEKIGKMIGVRMASVCPATVVKASAQSKGMAATAYGVVTKIDSDGFVVFTVQENNGRYSKFIWLQPVSSTLNLQGNYQSLQGKTVELKFETKDIFDPKIGDYRPFKILTALKLN
jgi:hypothetical protein